MRHRFARLVREPFVLCPRTKKPPGQGGSSHSILALCSLHQKNSIAVILNSVPLKLYCIVPLYFSTMLFTLCIPHPCLVRSVLLVIHLPVLGSIWGCREVVLETWIKMN